MAIDVELLERICEVPGAPGFEKRIRDLVLKELKLLAACVCELDQYDWSH